MRGPRWSRGWLFGVLVAMQAGGSAVVVAAELRLPAGTKDVTLAGAYSVSHKTVGGDEVETVDGFHLIPHFGYFVTEAPGPGWYRGSLELVAEPTLIHLDASESSTLVGLAAMVRWVFTGWPAFYPFVEAGGGVLGGQAHLRQTNCDVNYVIQGGVGGLVPLSEKTAITVGYRVQHLSNGDRCSQNLGLNSSVFQVGFSYFFP